MEKKNTGIIVLIVILSLLLGLLGGYIITDKVINKNINSNEMINSNGMINETNNNNNFDLENAKKLMDKYKVTDGIIGGYYITSLSDESQIYEIAMKQTKKTIKVTREKLMNTKVAKETFSNGFAFDEDEYDAYNYNDVLKTGEELFGSNFKLNKENKWIKPEWQYYYVEEYDFFAPFMLGYGGYCDCKNILTVDDVNIVGENLQIYSTRTIDYIDETHNKDVTTKYVYTFKKENNNYYLANITKLDS